jgi:uncharacterized membrane protein YqhA
MFKKLSSIRFIFILATLCILLGSITFMIRGAIRAIHSIYEWMAAGFVDDSGKLGIHLVESIDVFMIAILFMIFGLGIARLFIFDKIQNDQLPAWLHINDLKDLKILLWETIMVTLVITNVSQIFEHPDYVFKWELLILPIVILILTLSLFLMKKENH